MRSFRRQGELFKRFFIVFGVAVFVPALFGGSLAFAQDANQPTPAASATNAPGAVAAASPSAAASAASGIVRTAQGVPVPGATLQLTEISSGRKWVSWTDENGRFTLPGLPAGHYRAEVSQLGFEPTTQEFDLTAQNSAPLELTLKVATLEALEQANQSAAAAGETAQKENGGAAATGTTAAGTGTASGTTGAAGSAGATAAGAAPSSSGNSSQSASAAAPANGTGAGGGYRRRYRGAGGANGGGTGNGTGNGSGGGGQNGGGGGYGGGYGGRQGGFQQVQINGNNGGNGNGAGNGSNAANGGTGQAPLEAELGTEGAAGENADQDTGAGALGQASSSDAFLMNGTVGRGIDVNQGFGGSGGGGFGGPGGPGDQGATLPGGAGAVPGFAGAGGAAQGAGGAPGGGGFPGAGGFGGGGPGGPGGRGGGGPGGRGGGRPPAQGVAALWGAQRLARQRANRVRFSFYDTYTNSALDARPYSLTQENPAKLPTWNDSFGGNLGGPLVIPHIYNGVDKTFFFINYELAYGKNGIDTFSTVPTAAERGGDFTDRGAQLYCPSVNPYSTSSGLGAALAMDCPSPGGLLNPAAPGVIPANIMSNLPSSVTGLLGYIPEANLPGLAQNYHLQALVPTTQNSVNFRVLQTISSKLNASVAYNMRLMNTQQIQNFPDITSSSSTFGQGVTLGLTANISRRFIHTSQFYFTRTRTQSYNSFAFNDNVAGALGITGVSTAPIDYGIPQINFTNFSGLNDSVPSLTRNQTFRYADSFAFLRTKHTIHTGIDVRQMQFNTLTDPTPEGAFTFSGALTALPGSGGLPTTGTGLDFADFLLGLPSATTERFGTPSTYLRTWGLAAFYADDWHVRPSFTLDYGLRWDGQTPATELYNHLANLAVAPGFSEIALVTPGVAAPFGGSLPSSLLRGDYADLEPRIGIAWRPPLGNSPQGRTTVVRAGYSIFYNSSVYTQLAQEMINQPPFAIAQTLSSSAAVPLSLQNGFPTTGATTNAITNTIAINPDYKPGYAQVWNLSMETSLTRTTSLVVNYTGTKGTDLPILYGITGAVNANPLTAGQTTTVANSQGFTYSTFGASSIYNAVQLRIQHRMAKGFMLNALYVYGKSIDDASNIGGGGAVIVQNSNDLLGQRGLSTFDERHQFRLNYTYEIPLGDRHRFAQKGFSSAVIGNWRLSGTVAAHSGMPFTAQDYDSACEILPGTYSERANAVANPNLPSGQQTPLHWFNTAAFVAPVGSCIGDAGRDTITGPGAFTWNAQLAKTFAFGRDQQRHLEVRWESNNVLNTPNFTGLSTVVNSSTFGRVVGAATMRTMDVTMRVNF